MYVVCSSCLSTLDIHNEYLRPPNKYVTPLSGNLWRTQNVAIIIQQDAAKYSLFKSVNCSTCFGWCFTDHQELITLYLQHLALLRPLLLPVVSVAGWEFTWRQVAVQALLIAGTVDTVKRVPDDGWNTTRSMLSNSSATNIRYSWRPSVRIISENKVWKMYSPSTTNKMQRFTIYLFL
jgi:hypothetical protein